MHYKMHFTTFAAAALAFAGSAIAQYDPTPGYNPIVKPEKNEVVAGGATYNIEWQSNRDGAVTLELYGGTDGGHLTKKSTLATGVQSSANKYAWAVDASLGADATYGIKLISEVNTTVFQWSNPFSIKGSGASGSSSSAGSSGYATSASSSETTSKIYPTTVVTSQSVYSTVTPYGNSTTAASTTGATTLASTTPAATTTATRASSASSSVPTAAAPRVVAGSLALVGGIAAAVFAL